MLQAQGESFAFEGTALAQGNDFSMTLTQEACTLNMKFPPTPPKLSAG